MWIASTCVAVLQGAAPQTQQSQPDLINPDRPGIADGSNVIWPHRFQFETGLQWESHDQPGAPDKQFFVPTLFRFGVSDRFEARIETNGALAIGDLSDSHTAGYQPVSIGGKYHFQDGDGMRRASLATIIRIFPPSGSASFSSKQTQGDVRLVADLDIAPKSLYSINPNIGVASYTGPDGKNFTAGLAAMTLNYNPTDHLNFFIDTGAQTPEQPHGRNAVIADLGTALIIGTNLQLDFSIGKGISGSDVPRPFIGAGISIRY